MRGVCLPANCRYMSLFEVVKLAHPLGKLDHDGLLSVQAILGFIEYHRMRAIDNFIRDFAAAFRRQAVHHYMRRVGTGKKMCVNLVFLEHIGFGFSLILLAHRGPDIGINDIGIPDGLMRILGNCDFRFSGFERVLQDLLSGMVSLRVPIRKSKGRMVAASSQLLQTLLPSPR